MADPVPCPVSVSVAMTTFNGEDFIREQIESILDQSPAPLEIIVADDGSSDATTAVVRSLAADSTISVRLIGGDHVGLRGNVERAIAACRGDVIALADQDDVWQPGRLAAITEAFLSDAVSLWFSDAELIDHSGSPIGRTVFHAVGVDEARRVRIESGRGLAQLLHGMTVTGSTMAFRAALRPIALPLPPVLDGDDHLFLHDGWIAVLASLRGRTVIDPRRLTLYRQHAGQVTNMTMARDPESTPDANLERSARMDRELRQVSLVLQRLRETAALSQCRKADVEALVGRQRLLEVRTMPRGVARTARIAGSLLRGDYSRYARGVRSAAIDLVARRRT